MNWSGVLAQITELLLAVLLAPMLTGWVNQCRAWLQNKSGPGILLPYRMLGKRLPEGRRARPRRVAALPRRPT